MMSFAIEMLDVDDRYGRVHREGCRDLIDPLALGDLTSLDDLDAALDRLGTGWSPSAEGLTSDEAVAELRAMLAPCAATLGNQRPTAD